MKWDVYQFTKPLGPGAYKLLGQVDGEHGPAARKAAAGRWPALAVESADYPRGRLLVREEGDTRGMPGHVTIAAMPTRKPHPIQAVLTPRGALPVGFRLVRPGARYAVHREEDARPGAWLPDGEPLAHGWTDVYPENEARALLPFLRATGHGRKASDPTTADGKLVARACKRLGLTAAGLAERIGAHESVLSRARNGELPAKHREAIRALLRGGAKEAT